MTPAQRLAELREIFTAMHRDHSIGWYEAGTRFSDYALNNATDIAQRERELEERCEKLRERLSAQTKATQTIASELHNRVVESIVRIIGQPDYVDVQGHPIEQVVGTVLRRTVCDHQDTKDQLAAANAEIERLRQRIESLEKSEEVLSKVDMIATDVIGDHFDENGYIKGDGVWRIRAIENAVREIREVWSEFRESEATDE